MRGPSHPARWAKPAIGLGAALIAKEAIAKSREADLHGQVALVTGASRGLGLALAHQLAGEGCRLVICARDAEELSRAETELTARGAEVLAFPCDVGDRDQVAQLVDAANARFGQIDLLINNAGVIQAGPLQTATPEVFQYALDVMFWGVLHPTLAVLPRMRERHSGRIVNITSFGGKIAVPHVIPYCAAKFAAVGLSEGLRAELVADGVTVTTICPGEMRTGSYRNALFAGDREAEFRWFALGAALPTTVGTERAARAVIRATKRGQAELIFPWTFNLLARLHGLAPGLVTDTLGVVNRALPRRDDVAPGAERGSQIEPRIRDRLWDLVTAAGRHEAERWHQHPGPAMPAPMEINQPA
jgi:NAD(P)-dependent dehydrogenase (short-subunit alcohol dehydrogenase family)